MASVEMQYLLELYKTGDVYEASFYDYTKTDGEPVVRTFEVPQNMVAQIPGYLRMMEQMEKMR